MSRESLYHRCAHAATNDELKEFAATRAEATAWLEAEGFEDYSS